MTNKVKALIANIAQLLIVLILLPFACFLIQLISPDTTGEYLLGVFCETNYVKYFFDAIQSSITAYDFTQNALAYAETFNTMAAKCIMEASITGCCIFVFRMIWRFIKVLDGVWPLLPAVAATIVSCLILKIFEGDQTMMLAANVFMVVLSMVLALVYSGDMEEGRFLSFKRMFRVFFSIGFQAIIALVWTSYFCILLFIMNHHIETWTGIIYTLCIIAIVIVLSIIEELIAD